MLPSESEIRDFLGKEQFAPSILSSKMIVDFALRNGQLSKIGYIHELLGEAQFRHELFNGDTTDDLRGLLGREDVKSLIGESNKVAQYVESRSLQFKTASGIIAVVHTEHKEALPLAFIITKSTAQIGVYDSSTYLGKNEEVKEWSNHLASIAKGANAKFNHVQLQVPLGPFCQILKGSSHMLALAISMTPTRPDMKVLATGSIKTPNIERVTGIPEKQKLAKRMGAKFVSHDEEGVNVDFIIEENESLETFLSRWKKEFGPSLIEKLSVLLKRYWFQVSALSLLILVAALTIRETPPPLSPKDYSYKIKCPDKSCEGLMYYCPGDGKPNFRCTNYRKEKSGLRVKFKIQNDNVYCSEHSEKFILNGGDKEWLCEHENPCKSKFVDENLHKTIIKENYTGKIKCRNHQSGCKGFLKKTPGIYGWFYGCSEYQKTRCNGGTDFPLRCAKEPKESEIKLLQLRDINGTNKWVCPNFPSCDYSLEAFDHETN